MNVQTLTLNGDEFVLVPRREFDEHLRAHDALLARLGDDAAEDRMTDRLVHAARTARAAGPDSLVPGWLSAAILAGQHPIQAARERAKMDQAELADRVGVRQSHLADVEGGKRKLGAKALAAAATVLDVRLDWLAD